MTEGLRAAPLGYRQEELLSWLQGRQPVGKPVTLSIAEIRHDLRYRRRELIYSALYRLRAKGFVETVTTGNRRDSGSVKVVRRLEAA